MWTHHVIFRSIPSFIPYIGSLQFALRVIPCRNICFTYYYIIVNKKVIELVLSDNGLKNSYIHKKYIPTWINSFITHNVNHIIVRRVLHLQQDLVHPASQCNTQRRTRNTPCFKTQFRPTRLQNYIYYIIIRIDVLKNVIVATKLVESAKKTYKKKKVKNYILKFIFLIIISYQYL